MQGSVYWSSNGTIVALALECEQQACFLHYFLYLLIVCVPILSNADLADTSNKIPGGGFNSTAEDLVKFAAALQTGLLLKRETMQQMLTPMKTRDGKESPYFGWFIRDRNGQKLLTHGGAQQGTSTQLFMLPGKGFAVALMTNMEDVNLTEPARQIMDILLP
jgi:CubicO group peptidase (beta-lactamase class C family)